MTWFNPPYSQSISTNVGKKFLDLVDSCFPDGHELKKIINRNNVKVSYSTMPNMAQMLNQHNIKVNSSDNIKHTGGCNGHRGGRQCPVPGNCMAKGVVYGAEITDLATGNKETYTGLTEGTSGTGSAGMRETAVNETGLGPDYLPHETLCCVKYR